MDQLADLRLAHLLVGAQLLALYAHLLIYQRGEYYQRYMLHIRIILHKLCQPVAVHLRHLKVRDYQRGLLIQSAVLLGL